MAVLLMRNRVCAIATDSGNGTPANLTNSDGAENFFNPQIEADIPVFERLGQVTLSRMPGVPGARSGKFTCETHLYGNGTPFWASVMLPAAGLVGANGTYSPLTSANHTTNTCGYWVNTNLYEIAGAQCNLIIKADKVGEPVKLEWSYTGLYVNPSTVALIAPTYPTTIPSRAAAGALTIGNQTYVTSRMQFDLGNKVVLREDLSQDSGYIGAVITDRQPKLTVTLEVPQIATHDFFADLRAGTLAAFSAKFGNTTLAMPKLQINAAPKFNDKDGIFCYDLEFMAIRNAAGGDDEYTITIDP